ncbi:hypothetical protein H257_17401 [Aphanomyces astaci]|uniref:Uncharacterized protein n=1 Tax=Aphanomyces astaci TaxID=112090 RepID=W4FER1_APHAT|nr:hypothetical protein H257_17401 [Aphanomyces astaci]ETV65982.1 hypothetical protein H257_17401 [Aphanomyces astaci]|eukprot:XP_009844501.1 hypothetical protein H257_17401 [Aphanomyces astaci]
MCSRPPFVVRLKDVYNDGSENSVAAQVAADVSVAALSFLAAISRLRDDLRTATSATGSDTSAPGGDEDEKSSPTWPTFDYNLRVIWPFSHAYVHNIFQPDFRLETTEVSRQSRFNFDVL